jgi:hypothetical protein
MIACLGAIAWLVRPSGAEARDYPYCIKGDSYVSALGDCSFDTYAQCKASASGRLAWCDANPFYRPQADERGAYPDVRGRRFRR